MRQTVTARELVSSPPAPSPSKRPKRAGPYYAPYDLHRLAGRQIAHLHALVSGNERPFPGPIGLEEPIGAVTKFVTEAHAYWSMVSSDSMVMFRIGLASVLYGRLELTMVLMYSEGF